MPRLFTGVEIPEDLAFDLSLMKGGVPGARWIDAQSYHITLRFIGDIPLPLSHEISMALETVQLRPFTLRLKGIDVMGGNKPHTICAGVEESADLRRLQAIHERLMQSLGLSAEPRRFTPHVTLARLRDPDLVALKSYIIAHSLYASRPFDVQGFLLFSSRPSRGGGPYAIENSYHFQGQSFQSQA